MGAVEVEWWGWGDGVFGPGGGVVGEGPFT